MLRFGAVLGQGCRVVVCAGVGLVMFATTAALAAHGAGYRLVIITTGSMAPALPVDSLAIAAPTSARDVSVGDVVVMTRDDGVRVTHRVISIDGEGVGAEAVTQGDANADPDSTPYLLPAESLTVETVVPGVGAALAYLASPAGRFAAVAVVISMLSGLALWHLWAPQRGVRLSRQQPSIL